MRVNKKRRLEKMTNTYEERVIVVDLTKESVFNILDYISDTGYKLYSLGSNLVMVSEEKGEVIRFVPSYAADDYTLPISLGDSMSTISSGGVVSLPELSPREARSYGISSRPLNADVALSSENTQQADSFSDAMSSYVTSSSISSPSLSSEPSGEAVVSAPSETETETEVLAQPRASTPSNEIFGTLAVEGDVLGANITAQTKYGTVNLFDGNTKWRFVLDTSQPAYKSLGAGQILMDNFQVYVMDAYGEGSYIYVELTITGENDNPVISSDSKVLGTVVEDDLTQMFVEGKVGAKDADGDNLSYTIEGVANGSGSKDGIYGTLTLNPDGSWNYVLDNERDATNDLKAGDIKYENFTIVVSDGNGGLAKQVIKITVIGADDAPYIDQAAEGELNISVTEYNAGEGTDSSSVTGDLSKAIIDPEGGDLTYKAKGTSEYGVLTLDESTGAYTFKLHNNSSLVDSLGEGDVITQIIPIEVTDSAGNVLKTEITITINGANDKPTVNLGETIATGSVVEDGDTTEVTGKIIGSDVDKGDKLTYSREKEDDGEGGDENLGQYGDFTVNADGTWSYNLDNGNTTVQALDKGETLTDTITVTIKDESGASVTKDITVTINGTDDNTAPKVTTPGAVNATEDDATVTYTQIVATDAEGDSLTYTLLGSSQYGSLSIDESGQLTFALNNKLPSVQSLGKGDTIKETVTVEVMDEHGAKTTTQVTITITGSNDAPVVNVGSSTVTGTIVEDTVAPITGKVVATDVDNGDTLTYSTKSSGTYGTLTLNKDGTWSYVLDNSNTKVQALNASSDPLTDTITVVVTDSSGAKVEQEIVITIVGTDEAPYIDQGAAGSHVISATEDSTTASTGDLTEYIKDPEGGSLTFKLMGASNYGTLTLNDDGSYSFSIDNSLERVQELSKGQKITEVLPIIVEDAEGNQLHTTITINITGVNDAPTINVGETISKAVAVEDSVAPVGGKVVGNDIDALDSLEYSLSGKGTYGTFVINETTGEWSYVLDNTNTTVQALGGDSTPLVDKVTVIVKDGNGGSTSQVIEVQVTGTDEAPILNVEGEGSSVISATEDSTAAVTGDLSKDITDPDGDSLSFTLLGSSQYGSLTLNEDGSYSFTLDNSLGSVQALSKGQVVTEVIPILVSDGTNELNTTITINITGVNDAPTIDVGSSISKGIAVEDGVAPVEGKIVGADIDNGDKLSYAIKGSSDGTYGKLTLNKDGTWSYKLDNSNTTVQALDEGDKLQDTFTVTVSDGKGGTVEQVITIDVLGSNEAPVLNIVPNGKDTINIAEDTSKAATGDMNDYVKDPEGETLQFALQGGSKYGTLTLNPNGTYNYVIDNKLDAVQSLAEGQVIVETIPVLVTDAGGNQLNTYIKVKITGTNDAPTVNTSATNALGEVTEDASSIARGIIVGSDVDNGDKLTYSREKEDDGEGGDENLGQYGDFTVNADGTWSYSLDNTNTTVQALDKGETLTDTITVPPVPPPPPPSSSSSRAPSTCLPTSSFPFSLVFRF